MTVRDRTGPGGSEEGVSAVLVVLSLFVLLGAAALAVDAGALWMTKRNFVTDTDAAALAAARVAAVSDCSTDFTTIEAEAEEYLAYNQGGTVAGDASVSCGVNTVTVEFTGQAPMTFAGVFGFSKLDVFSSSTARFDPPGGGLRPLATCMSSPIVTEGEATHQVVFSATAGAACGLPSGNWGWLCLELKDCETTEGGKPGSGEYPSDYDCSDPRTVLGFLRCGYGDPRPEVHLGSSPDLATDDEDCTWRDAGNPDTEDLSEDAGEELVPIMDWCWTKPGVNVGEMAQEPRELKGKEKSDHDKAIDVALDEKVFPILLFDRSLPGGSGRDVLHPKAYMWVRFDGYCLNADSYDGVVWNATNSSACSGSEFILQFTRLGIQTADDDIPAAVRSLLPVEVSICGVDHDPAGGVRC